MFKVNKKDSSGSLLTYLLQVSLLSTLGIFITLIHFLCFISKARCVGEFQSKGMYSRTFNPFVPNAHFLYPLKTSENPNVF